MSVIALKVEFDFHYALSTVAVVVLAVSQAKGIYRCDGLDKSNVFDLLMIVGF